jgi:hypothetical protein
MAQSRYAIEEASPLDAVDYLSNSQKYQRVVRFSKRINFVDSTYG